MCRITVREVERTKRTNFFWAYTDKITKRKEGIRGAKEVTWWKVGCSLLEAKSGDFINLCFEDSNRFGYNTIINNTRVRFCFFYWRGRDEGNTGVEGMEVEEGLTKLGD